MDKLDQRLAEALQKVRHKNKLVSMAQTTQAMLFEAQTDLEELREKLSVAQSDVKQLEGLTILSIFHTILGSKEQRLAQEQQELALAKLKYDQALITQADLQQELAQLRTALEAEDYQNAERQYQQLLDEKQLLLIQSQDERGRAAEESTLRIEQLKIDKSELLEAISAGETALAALERTRTSLSEAQTWGIIDLAGGKMMSSMIKHSYIDDAASHAREAQRALNRFREELADAGNRLHMSIQVDFVSSFADGLLDGIVIDWIMQSHIDKALQQCIDFKRRVDEALEQCKGWLKELENQLAEAETLRRNLLHGPSI